MSDNIFIEPICQICGKEFKSLDPIGSHVVRIHGITLQEYYDKYYKKEGEEFCRTCGKPTKFFKLRHGYQKYCCSACASKNKEWQANREKTYIEKYGAKTYAASDEGKERIKQTNLEKYGVSCTLNTEENIKKKKETWLKNYGTEYASQSIIVKEKMRQTCLEKYGTENFSNSEIFKTNYSQYLLKTEKTCFERYGVKNISQLHECHVKRGKKYSFNGIYFDSSWEIAYYIWLNDNNINFIYQPDLNITYNYNGKEYHYFPDFMIDNKIIEIKNNYLYDKMQIENTKANAKYKCALANNVIFMLENDIKPYLKYINYKYGKNYLKNFHI